MDRATAGEDAGSSPPLPCEGGDHIQCPTTPTNSPSSMNPLGVEEILEELSSSDSQADAIKQAAILKRRQDLKAKEAALKEKLSALRTSNPNSPRK